MTKFDKAFEEMQRWEGGFSDDKYDPGGKTIWGITEKHHFRTYHTIMGLLKRGEKGRAKEIAKGFYYNHHWNPLYDEIPDTSLAFKLLDFGVNAGVKRAVKILQRTLNSLGNRNSLKLKVDGIFGANTLYFIKVYEHPQRADPYNAYIKRLGRFYRSLEVFFRFGRGWMRRLKNRYYL